MAQGWTATKARFVREALVRLGWREKDGKGGVLLPPQGSGTEKRPYPFHYHDRDVIGPPALAKLGRYTGLTPDKL